MGGRCPTCGLTTVADTDHCPECDSALEEALFGPTGRVTAATVLHVGVPGHEPPYSLGYVVLDDGPRVLAHLPDGRPLTVGSVVVLAEPGPSGDLRVESGGTP